MYERLVLNLTGDKKLRRSTLNGRRHVIVPTVILKEEVLDGSNGPLFYPGDENRKWTTNWNHKPIVVYHPTRNDQPISACDPDVLESRAVGLLLNSKTGADGTTRVESWVDEDKCNSVDRRIVEALDRGEKVEVSTGLDLDLEMTAGEHNGTKYVAVARNYRPDHLAALPDKIGALSVAMGGGMLQLNQARDPERTQTVLQNGLLAALKPLGVQMTGNELSFSALTRKLSDLLAYAQGEPGKYWPGYVHEVFSDRVIFCGGTEPYQMWMQKYATDGDKVSLTGTPEKVDRVVEYVTSDGKSYVGNAGSIVPKQAKETVVAFNKKVRIDQLIRNGVYLEQDRSQLDGLSEALLERIPVTNSATTQETTTTPKPQESTTNQGTNTTQTARPKTDEEYIAGLPPRMQGMVRNGLASFNAEMDRLVEEIVTNSKNPPAKEFLQAKPIEELRWLADQVRPTQSPPSPAFHPSYFGAQGGMTPTVNANPDPVDYLPLPNFETAAK